MLLILCNVGCSFIVFIVVALPAIIFYKVYCKSF
jgi:hypothetical protein